MANREPPERLPGPTAGAVLWRTLPFIALATLAAPAMMVQAYVPAQDLWVAVWLTVAFVLLALFVRGLKRTRDLERAEVARGYTTMLQVAREQPQLWLFDAETGVPLSGPGEPRPADVRRGTVEAWLADRRS